jgi:hypothetical protein
VQRRAAPQEGRQGKGERAEKEKRASQKRGKEEKRTAIVY